MDWDNNRCVPASLLLRCQVPSCRCGIVAWGSLECSPHPLSPFTTHLHNRAAAVVCQLQGEYEEELRFQFAHLAAAYPVPPDQRTTAQRDRLVATALELVGTYADGTALEARRTALVAHVRAGVGAGVLLVTRSATGLTTLYPCGCW